MDFSYLSPALLCDFYKLSHRAMYPAGTEYVYSTWTPRASRIEGIDEVVAFGFQMAVRKIHDFFNARFFARDVADVIQEYKALIESTLFVTPDTAHLEELHAMQYLPIAIKALPEGTRVPLRVPMLTIQNTTPRFFWLTNYLETLLSCQLWQPATAATLAYKFRKLLDKAAELTGADKTFVPFQGHDFSMRGMSSLESAIGSGLGHLLSFVGTDTIPAIQAAQKYYNAPLGREIIGTSVPATEHSVQCAYGDDLAYFKRIINEVHPTGVVSIVADGYDFWRVLTEILPALKDDIMRRDGKVVIRPDSGDPVHIVCGNKHALGHPAHVKHGAVQTLWNIFGGHVNDRGFRELDSHIGLIYGDAITYERAERILTGLADNHFASSNIVFGIGSYTYQYNTRDTFGFAMKSTACVINGEEKAIFKNPKTDDGTKHSLQGRVAVVKGSKLRAIDGLSIDDVLKADQLIEIYRDGEFASRDTLSNIRKRLHGRLA